MAVEPAIRAINIRGLQIGGTTELICDGDDFTTEPKLLLPFAVEQSLKEGSTDKRATFSVKLVDNIEPGYYQLRVATAGGVSLPIVIGVDRLPQQELKTPVEKLPVAVHGSVSGSGIVEVKFTGKKGESIAAEVEAQRLGSKLRPVIHLLKVSGTGGRQLLWRWSESHLFSEARVEVVLPDDGEYRVTVHDLEYAAPSPSFFRLKIGQWTSFEQAIPAVVPAGQQQTVEVRTNTFNDPPQTKTEQQTVDPQTGPFARLKITAANFAGPRPFVRLSTQQELRESETQGRELSLAAGPIGISGQLLSVSELDSYRLAVKPGDKIRCEIFGQRYGAPLDAKLILSNDKEAAVAQGEDSPGSLDPVVEYTVPDKMTTLIVGVIVSQRRAGPQAAYHLNIRNLNDVAAGTDYRLLTNLERTAISKGGRWVVPVWADRRGYNGAIELSANGLPPGISVSGNTIPAGASGTLVTLTANDTEPPQLAAISHWQGKTAEGKTQPVLLKNHPLEMLQPWLAEEIAVARVNSPAADFAVDWRDLPESAALAPTAKLALPIKIARTDDKLPVRLSLVTSQLAPLNNNQSDPSKTLRVEKAVELGAKTNDGEVTLLVPQDLAEDAYDLAIQAELLSADKQKVLATSFTPVRRLPVLMPVEVQLAGEPKIDVMLDAAKGAMQKIDGTVKRREGIAGDVTIALTGLPAGARADAPVVKADANAFSVNVVLPANQPAGELTGLKLSATIVPDPKQANARVKSREVDLKLNVIRPTP